VVEGEAACAIHPGNESVGPCGRCGNYLCEVCRTRWRDQVLCPACVERALGANESSPEQTRAMFRRALWSTIGGGGAWVFGIAWIILDLVVVVADSPNSLYVIALLMLLGLLVAATAASFGVGLAVSVLRARGSHMILATFGLLLSGLFLGYSLGRFAIGIWQHL